MVGGRKGGKERGKESRWVVGGRRWRLMGCRREVGWRKGRLMGGKREGKWMGGREGGGWGRMRG